MIGIYAKAIVAAVVVGLTSAVTALGDGTITAYEWTVIAAAVLVGLGGVWGIPNLPDGVKRYGKAIVAGLVAVVAAVGAAVVDGTGISTVEWLGVAIALAAGLGLTYAVPNAAVSDTFTTAH